MVIINNAESAIIVGAISKVLGWLYFISWSLSFYPQPFINWKRKSTQGLTIDFPTLNLLGFTAYGIVTAAFLWSPVVREQYAQRHKESPEPTVRFNDWVFAAHAFVLCAITYSQFWPALWGFQRSGRQKASRLALTIVIGSFIAIIASILLVLRDSNSLAKDRWQWIDAVSRQQQCLV
jgi:cystinosin